MDLLKLKYFYTVAQLEHITKAAERLHIAQPAITKTIKLIESELGVPLFSRVGRNIKLTEYGKLLKNRLDSVFPIIDGIESEIKALKRENSYTVRLNVMAASIAVMQAVLEYKNLHPEVVFNLNQHSSNVDCDISLTTDFAGDTVVGKKTAIKRCVIEEKIFLAVPKISEYAKRDSIELLSLKDEKFIYIAGSRPFRAVCDKICSDLGFKPSIDFESDSPIAVKNIISADAGVGFWPQFSWGEIDKSGVKLIPISDADCKRNLVVELHSDNCRSKYAESFYSYLIEQLSKGQNS